MNMNKKGFTLIELMIVVAIIAILAMIAIPMYQRYIERSRNSATQNVLHQLSTAMEAYQVDNGVYVSDATSGYTAGKPRIDALMAYGFRVDPNVAFTLAAPTAIGTTTPLGFIACAVHRARGSRMYAYDAINGTGVMAMASLSQTVVTPTIPAVTLNTACTSPLQLWVADTTNPTTAVVAAAIADVAVNATGTVD